MTIQPSHKAPHTPPKLVRVMGLWHLISLGVGVTVGAGIFSITGIAAGQYAGPSVLISFILAGVICGLVGLCYGELSAMMPDAEGSVYSYTKFIFGRKAGWFMGWDLLLEYIVAASAVATSWSGYMISLLKDWGIYFDPRWTSPSFTPVILDNGQQAYAYFNLPSVIILILVSVMLMRGTKESSTVNTCLVILKILIIMIVIFLCIPFISLKNFHPFIPHNNGVFGHFGVSGIVQAASMIFFAYLGFDIISTTARDAKKPKHTIPLAIIGSILISSLIYIIFATVMVGVVNYHHFSNDPRPVATILDQIHKPKLASFIKLAIAVGYFSVIYGLLLGQSRIILTLSEDNLIPSFFSHVQTITKTPWRAHIILAIIGSLFAGILPISLLGAMTSIGTLLAFIVVCSAVIFLRYKAPNRHRPFKIPAGIILPLIGEIGCLAIMISMDSITWLRLFIWLIIGGFIYFFYGRYQSYNNSPVKNKD